MAPINQYWPEVLGSRLANQTYLQQGYIPNQQFYDVATDQLSSDVEVVNFSKPTETAAIIDRFVEEKTNHKIQNFIDPKSLDSDSLDVLVNAIYLKGKWEEAFQVNDTREEDFYSSETEKAPIKFMHKKAHFNYATSFHLDAAVLEMKYVESELSLLVILPNKRSGLAALESKLKDANLKTITEELYREYVDVLMPKFKIEYQVNLKDVLKKVCTDLCDFMLE